MRVLEASAGDETRLKVVEAIAQKSPCEEIRVAQFMAVWALVPFNVSRAFMSNFSGRHSWSESCSSSEGHSYRQGETMTLTHIRCPSCDGKNAEEQRTYTIKCGTPRTLYHCSFCERSFSETRNTPIAQLKTPIALVVQVLTALTEGVGINAATRLYSVSKNSIYRWQERLSGVKKRFCCLL